MESEGGKSKVRGKEAGLERMGRGKAEEESVRGREECKECVWQGKRCKKCGRE